METTVFVTWKRLGGIVENEEKKYLPQLMRLLAIEQDIHTYEKHIST